MEQYRQGEAFVAAIARARGARLCGLCGSSETLPRPDEIDLPSLWVARVLPAQGRAARHD